MFDVRQTTLDATGKVLEDRDLFLAFGSRDEAAVFMQQYIGAAFQNGRGGYLPEGDCWWGCDESADTQLHRYRIVTYA